MHQAYNRGRPKDSRYSQTGTVHASDPRNVGVEFAAFQCFLEFLARVLSKQRAAVLQSVFTTADSYRWRVVVGHRLLDSSEH